MAEEIAGKGATPEPNGTLLPENGTVTDQGVYWRNKGELQEAIVNARRATSEIESLKKQLADQAEKKPDPAPKVKPDEALEHSRALERKLDFRDALDSYTLTATEKQQLKDWFEESRPEKPGDWLKSKIEKYGFGKTTNTTSASVADERPAPGGVATVPQVEAAAPGREPGGVMQGSPQVFARQNPAAWRALSPEQRVAWVSKHNQAANPRSALLPANRIKNGGK